jgi:hypothetical protein
VSTGACVSQILKSRLAQTPTEYYMRGSLRIRYRRSGPSRAARLLFLQGRARLAGGGRLGYL